MSNVTIYVRDQAQNYYFEKITTDLFAEAERVETVFTKAELGEAIDQHLVTLFKRVIDQLEKIGEVEDYLRVLSFRIQNGYDSVFVSQHFLVYENPELEALLDHVLAEVADPLAEGYFESLIDYLEGRLDDEVFVDFRLNGDELLLEASSHGRKVKLVEGLRQLVIDYEESFERVATELLESLE